jgi:hypothetical protein
MLRVLCAASSRVGAKHSILVSAVVFARQQSSRNALCREDMTGGYGR